MGKASSNKKVARAARAGGKGKASKATPGWVWPVSIGLVVVLGTVLIVLSRGDSADAEAPTFNDHWHEAYGVYVCDSYLPQFPDNVQFGGIHTHNDGLIHVEPFSSLDTGENATFGRFAEGVGLEISDDQSSMTLPDGRELEDGDDCNGEPGELRVLNDDQPVDGDPNDIRLDDGGVIAVIFAPEDAEIPDVPYLANLDDPNAGEGGGTPQVTLPPEGEGGGEGSTTTAPAGGSTTTAPAGGSTTTAPAGGSTTAPPAPSDSSTTTAAP